MKRYLIGLAAALLGTAMITGTGLQTASAAAPVLESQVTLPLFGATLQLDIVNGPGGSLKSVAVTPAGGNVATKLDAHKVVFESADLTDPIGDPAKVVIKSRNGTQKISAKAGSLADFLGTGGWKGDVFGDGVVSTVAFTIGGTDAAPTITVGAITGSASVVGPVQTSSGDDDGDDNEASARVSIAFTNAAGDQTRSLTIKVKVEADDGDNEAKLSISLGKVKGVAGKAVGAHTWSGLLCDSTVGTFAYSVAADGAVTVTPGANFTVATDEGKTTVTFATGERVSIKVRENDGEMKVSVKERIRCDSPDPTTNVSTSIPSDDENDGDHHDGDHNDGDHNDGKHNNGG